MTTPPDEESYTHILVGDVEASRNRIAEVDTPVARRDLIRATFAAVEGLLWRLRGQVLSCAKRPGDLSIHEIAALKEESYNTRDDGTIVAQSRYLPTATSIRVTVRVAKRLLKGYELDFSHVGWACLQRAITVRNRLTHPKTPSDLTVSDKELDDCVRGFFWFLALIVDIGPRIIAELEHQIHTLKR